MVRIITDSASDMLQTDAVKKGVTVLPLTVHFNDEGYRDGVDLLADEFFEKLIESDTLPTTSQIPPQVFEEEFKKVKAAGDTAVVILVSSELSGTFQSAHIAAADYEGIYIVDSLSATIGEQCLIEYAIRMRDEGKKAEEISKELDARKNDVIVLGLLDTLEYLKKGGRISATTAFVGGVLAIKPVVTVEDGKVVMLGKARGSKNGNNLLVELISKVGGIDFEMPYFLGYSGKEHFLLDKYIEDSKHIWEGHIDYLPKAQIGPTIGTHVGPGAIALAFFKK